MIIKHEDIAIMFNAVIYKFMMDGYVVSPFTSNGSYSDVTSFVDMIKPNDNSHIIRIWLHAGMIKNDNYDFHFIDIMSICVKKYCKDSGYDGKSNINQTFWFNKGECIFEKVFYQIANRDNRKVYAYCIEDSNKYTEISYNRRNARSCIDTTASFYSKEIQINKLSNKFINSVMDKIHNTRGFKRANADCINKVILKRNGFGKLSANIFYNFNDKSGVISLN